MNKELMGALDELERDKNISKETLLDAIEQSLIQACKNHFGKADNVHVTINPRDLRFQRICGDRTVVEFVDGSCRRDFPGGSTEDERPTAEIGDTVKVPIHSNRIRPYRHTECEERDPSEDPRGRAQGSLRSVLRQRERRCHRYRAALSSDKMSA